MSRYLYFLLVFISCFWSCHSQTATTPQKAEIITGPENTEAYLPLLQGKSVGVVSNQSGLIGTKHLVDSLLAAGIQVKKIFCPEHGFRGNADAGAKVKDGKDPKTGLPILSLYGKNKKPSAEAIADLDVIVFCLQDVGVRFYTYISTLHYVMEACAENGKTVIVLDMPNPNAHYVDGGVLDTAFQSFVGMHPVPVVYGMTIGEYGKMINGEKWLKGEVQCSLEVIPLKNYTHDTPYALPVKPSPNLPNPRSIELYPSLCFFEGTAVSVGRGTDFPFQVFGHPRLTGSFSFVPRPIEGAALHPKLEGDTCRGIDLRQSGDFQAGKLNLQFLIRSFQQFEKPDDFFTSVRFFDLLAGGSTLRESIIAGKTEDEIRAEWKTGLDNFTKIRACYLLYP